MAVFRYKISMKKNAEGRFGFAFDALHKGTYEISKVSDWVTQNLKCGDILKSVNNVTTDLEQYCRSEKALSLSEWQLVVERPSQPQGSPMPSQPTPTTLRPPSPGESSLDFSLISGNGPTLQELAVDKPTLIIWSDAFDVIYDNASHIDHDRLKFKKKETKKEPKEEWILLVKIMHSPAYPYTYLSDTNRLQPGDWMLKIDNAHIPFYCTEGTTTWFKRRLLSLRNQALKVTVRRPVTSIAETLAIDETLASMTSVTLSVPPSHYKPSANTPSNSSLRYSDFSQAVSGAEISVPTSTDAFQELTDNPELLRRGQTILDTYRRSIQLKPVDKLGRCRLIFHHIGTVNPELTEYVQNEIFGYGYLSGVEAFGGYVKEYHVHLILTEDGGIFSQPTSEDCVSPVSSTCSFEMHETIGRISEKTALSPQDRQSLLDLPDHISSGPVSIASLKRRTHTPEVFNANKMHLEVLSLTGAMAAKYNNWCFPIIYCKYAIHVLVIDVSALLNPHLSTQLSRTLCDISTYSSKTPSAGAESPGHPTTGSRVLLVILQDENYELARLSQLVEQQLHLYLHMLIVTDDNWPFVLVSHVKDIPQMLFKELRQMSSNACMDNIQHAGVMLSQQLKNTSMQITDLDELKKQLRESVVSQVESDTSTWHSLVDGTFKYLHNTGLAYIPDLSYSKSIGHGCVNVRYTSLIHPHRLVSTVDRLMQQMERFRGMDTDATWKRLIANTHAEKLLGMLRDVHLMLPVYSTDHGEGELIVLPLAHFNPIGQPPPDGNPALLLKYRNGSSFLLLTAFLNYLSSQSVSSNLDYHVSCGIFHMFHHTIQVYRTTNTRFGWRAQQPIAVTDQSLSFFVSSTSPEKMSTKGLTSNLKKLITNFHSTPGMARDRPIFGPPCPLEDRCSRGPFHVIDILGNSPLSCSGISLERSHVVTDYVVDERFSNVADVGAKRAAILGRPANQLPLSLIEQLDESNPLQRNWIGLARLENFTPLEIERLEKTGCPTYSLLSELSNGSGYTIETLFKRLVTNMELESLAKSINDWIDLECIK